jgi:hypothetical protein
MGGMGRPAAVGKPRTEVVKARMTPAERAAVEKQAAERGFKDASAYVRHLVSVDGRKIAMEKR